MRNEYSTLFAFTDQHERVLRREVKAFGLTANVGHFATLSDLDFVGSGNLPSVCYSCPHYIIAFQFRFMFVTI